MSVDILQLTAALPPEQQKAVQTAYRRQAKDSTTAFLLCFFLGIFGAHCFYLGRVGQGIVRLVIAPLILPGLVWEVVDLLRIDNEVHARNLKLAERLVAQAMLNTPNSAALQTALGQLDATLRQQEEAASFSQAAPHSAVAAVRAEPAGAAATASSATMEMEAPTKIAQDAAVAGGEGDHLTHEAGAPAPERAPVWPVAPEVALAAEHEAGRLSGTEAGVAAAQTQDPSPTPLVWPADLTAFEQPPAAPAEPAGPTEPGTAALAFGWAESAAAPAWSSGAVGGWFQDATQAEGAAAEDAVHVPHEDPTDAFSPTDEVGATADIGELATAARVSVPVPEAEPLTAMSDPTDLEVPLDADDGTADIGELTAARRVWVPVSEEDLAADGADNDLLVFGGAPQPGLAGVSSKADTGEAALIFVADDGSQPGGRPDDSLADLAVLQALGAEAAGGEPEDSLELPPEMHMDAMQDAGSDAAPFEYEAHVAEEPSTSDLAAEPRRVVKKVRVIRRLVVNGQVVRETSAEQVVDGDADTQVTAAQLQRTLATADPETLAALTANGDATLQPGAASPVSGPDATSAQDEPAEPKE